MKPGRNAPCPCASGKKYKRCCYNNTGGNKDIAAANSANAVNSDEDEDDTEFLMAALNNFRKLTLKSKPHIKEYYKVRRMHAEIVDAMIKYYDDGKFEFKECADFSAMANAPAEGSKTGLKNSFKNRPQEVYLLESSFDFETNEGAHAFYDMMIYKSAPNINCITQDFIRANRYRKPEKIELLHAMLNSKLGLFEIARTEPGEGYAYVKDVFTGEEYKITDIGLSGNNNNDSFYIYTRMITYRNINFGTGLNFLFSKTDPFIKSHIRQHMKDYSLNGQLLRFTQLYNRYSNNPDRVKVVANTLR